MKHILLMRHAKSSWKDLNQKDKDRPLNKRGIRDAPIMAKNMLKYFPVPERIFCSTSNRTKETLSYLKPMLIDSKIELVDPLYHGSVENYESSIYTASNEEDCLLLIGHNPAMTEMANLSGAMLDNVATSGIIYIRSDIKEWTSFNFNESSFVEYIYPKLFSKDI